MNADRMECPHSGLACVSGVSLVCWLACQWCVSVVCAGWLVSVVCLLACQLYVGWLVSVVYWLACQWCVSVVCWLACVRGVLAVNCQSVGIIGKAEIVAQLALAGAGDDKCQ